MKALYAGSFDPFTIGHLSVVESALRVFDSLVIGVGYNENKKNQWTPEERVKAISEFFKGDPRIRVEAYTGLTVEFAKETGAEVLVRGVRNSSDFEKEKELADINMEVMGLQSVFFPCVPSLSFVSSSMVRELMHNGYDVRKYIVGDFPMKNN